MNDLETRRLLVDAIVEETRKVLTHQSERIGSSVVRMRGDRLISCVV